MFENELASMVVFAVQAIYETAFEWDDAAAECASPVHSPRSRRVGSPRASMSPRALASAE